jgi:photosystem II stability/assembly factor-like uncharacterized protein
MNRPLACLAAVATLGLLLGVGGASRATASRPQVGEVELARLASSQLGLVVVSPHTPSGVIPCTHLFAGSSTGERFVEVGPRLPCHTRIDDVFFLDREYGWIAVWNTYNVSVSVYRTSDGGRHWRDVHVTEHTMGVGAVSTLQFVTPERGWLVNQQPTAPNASLYTTSDGGRTWRLVNGDLPAVAGVSFRNRHEAWQSGGLCSCGLFRSLDGGRTWTRMHPERAGNKVKGTAFDGPPRLFGKQILEPVTIVRHGRANLAVYRSHDDGQTWQLAARLNVNAPPGSCSIFPSSEPLAVSLPTSRTWWVGLYRSGRWYADRTVNAGKSWTLDSAARVDMHRGEDCGSAFPAMQALGGDTAWLSFTAGPNDSRLYVTTDGGKRWRRVERAP